MSVALLFVLGLLATGAVIALATVALRDTAAPPSAPRSTVRQASIVCPEVGNLKRVWMDVAPDGAPTVVRCDRFGHHEVTCGRRCLIPVGAIAA